MNARIRKFAGVSVVTVTVLGAMHLGAMPVHGEHLMPGRENVDGVPSPLPPPYRPILIPPEQPPAPAFPGRPLVPPAQPLPLLPLTPQPLLKGGGTPL
jgi:hypothetical protein